MDFSEHPVALCESRGETVKYTFCFFAVMLLHFKHSMSRVATVGHYIFGQTSICLISCLLKRVHATLKWQKLRCRLLFCFVEQNSAQTSAITLFQPCFTEPPITRLTTSSQLMKILLDVGMSLSTIKRSLHKKKKIQIHHKLQTICRTQQ